MEPIKPKIGMKRFFVWFWGLLTLAGCAWIAYGVSVSGRAFEQVSSTATSSAGVAGAGIGAGLGVTFFLCTGGPVFILGLVFYLVTSSRIRAEQRHAETLNTLRDHRG